MKQLLIIFGVIAVLTSCNARISSETGNDSAQAENLDEQNVLKVYVYGTGKITLNNTEISLEDLDERLKGLKENEGMVYFSRDEATDEPPEESMQVIQMVVKHELPIAFYTDKTFKTPVEM